MCIYVTMQQLYNSKLTMAIGSKRIEINAKNLVINKNKKNITQVCLTFLENLSLKT